MLIIHATTCLTRGIDPLGRRVGRGNAYGWRGEVVSLRPVPAQPRRMQMHERFEGEKSIGHPSVAGGEGGKMDGRVTVHETRGKRGVREGEGPFMITIAGVSRDQLPPEALGGRG